MIRKCQTDDLEKLLTIWLKGSLQAHGFVSSDYWNKMLPMIKKYYLPNTETFVFEDKRQIKAFISMIDDQYIGALFVDPNFQNMKIGTKLINYVNDDTIIWYGYSCERGESFFHPVVKK